jgi:hypothetical protein
MAKTSKTPPGERVKAGAFSAFEADITLARVLTTITGENHSELIRRLMRDAMRAELRGCGQDPDRLVAARAKAGAAR